MEEEEDEVRFLDADDSESTARSIALADSATPLGAETFPQSSESLAKAAAWRGRGKAKRVALPLYLDPAAERDGKDAVEQ